MFTTRDVSLGALPAVELDDDSAHSLAVVAPSRGAIVTRWRVGDRELLYLDESTLRDPAANVRGGVPVLFPSPGKLTDDTWRRRERSGVMKQHGFARTLPWRVLATRADDGGAAVDMELTASERTLLMFPWEFRARMTVAVKGPTLRVDLVVENTAPDAMPFAAGFHPYFAVPQSEKSRATIPTVAKTAYDNTTKQRGPFAGFDLTQREVDVHLVDHGRSDASLVLPDGAITLRASDEFSWWVVWTLAGRDFVCLEPWTAPGDALNTNERVITLKPGEARALWVDMTWEPAATR